MRGMGRLGHYSEFERGMNGMGANCPDGYYDLKILGVSTGQCLPNLNTAVNAAQGGVMSSVGTGVANSAATQAAATAAAGNALGAKIIGFYKNNTMVAIGATVVVGGLLVYGAMSFLRGK